MTAGAMKNATSLTTPARKASVSTWPPPSMSKWEISRAPSSASTCGSGAISENQRAVAMAVGEKMQPARELAGAREHDAVRLKLAPALAAREPHGELRVVAADGLAADKDGIGFETEPMRHLARGGGGEPAIIFFRCDDPPVERKCDLGHHPGPVAGDRPIEIAIERGGLVRHQSVGTPSPRPRVAAVSPHRRGRDWDRSRQRRRGLFSRGGSIRCTAACGLGSNRVPG